MIRKYQIPKTERNREIFLEYSKNKKRYGIQSELAKKYHISRMRISQIISGFLDKVK